MKISELFRAKEVHLSDEETNILLADVKAVLNIWEPSLEWKKAASLHTGTRCWQVSSASTDSIGSLVP